MAQTQTSTTGNLQKMSRIMLTKARYQEEHNMPCVALIDRINLANGHYQVDIPKVEQMTASDLVDGVDFIDSEEISPSIVSATAAEVGIKVIVTDRLLRQNNESVFSIIGRQMGDAMARKKDTDVIALFSAFSTSYGQDNALFNIANISAVIGNAKKEKIGTDFIVHHPLAVWKMTSTVNNLLGTYTLPDAFQKPPVKEFWTGIKLSGVPIFEDGNIEKNSNDSGYGVVASRDAMGYLVASGKTERRQRDESLRATEVVIVEEYGMFEADDSRGAALLYDFPDAGAAATS